MNYYCQFEAVSTHHTICQFQIRCVRLWEGTTPLEYINCISFTALPELKCFDNPRYIYINMWKELQD